MKETAAGGGLGVVPAEEKRSSTGFEVYPDLGSNHSFASYKPCDLGKVT